MVMTLFRESKPDKYIPLPSVYLFFYNIKRSNDAGMTCLHDKHNFHLSTVMGKKKKTCNKKNVSFRPHDCSNM